MADLRVYCWGQQSLLDPKRFKAVQKLGEAAGQNFDGFVAAGRPRKLATLDTWLQKPSNYEVNLTGATDAWLSATKDAHVRGVLRGVTADLPKVRDAFEKLCTVGAFTVGSLLVEGTGLQWKRRGEGVLLPDPGWLMYFGSELAAHDVGPEATALKKGFVVQLGATPGAQSQAALDALEVKVFAAWRKLQAKKLGYDFVASVHAALGPTFAALGLSPHASDDPTQALFRGGTRGAKLRVDEDGEYGVLTELQHHRGTSMYVHWPEKPKAGTPPHTNAWLKKKDVERHLGAMKLLLEKSAAAWFEKMESKALS